MTLLWHCDAMSRTDTLLAWDQVAHLLKGRECSNPRDMIFGLQACVMPYYRIRVHYNISPVELFMEVAKALRPSIINQRDMATWRYDLQVFHRALKIVS
jgi:hypothetical protein